MVNYIYILSACDAWSSKDSMRIQGVTTDETMLHAMLAAKIKTGDMEYGGFSGKAAWQAFQKDFHEGEVDLNKLKYGFVMTHEDMQITEPLSMAAFPEAAKAYEEITGAKAKAALETLGLDRRSLTYSMVEVRTDSDYQDFLVPGICDRDSLESSDGFQKMMEDAEDTEVNVSVHSYNVGTGESEYPDEEELKILAQYEDELEEYGVDCIQTDHFGFYYENEMEY